MSERWELISKILVALGVLCVTFLIPILVQIYFFNSRNQKTSNENAAEQLMLFQIDSLPPQTVFSGSEFSYQVVWKYNGAEKVSLSVDEKPTWLRFDDTTNSFAGVIPSDISFFKLKVTAKAGALTDIQEASVEVKKPEEQKVSGDVITGTPTPTMTVTPTVSATIMDTPSVTPSVTVESSLPKNDTFEPTGAAVIAAINTDDPFHPALQITDSPMVVENRTSTSSGSVLGVSAAYTDLPATESGPNYIPVIGGIAAIILIVISAVIFLMPKKNKDIIKTHSGLIIHSTHDKGS